MMWRSPRCIRCYLSKAFLHLVSVSLLMFDRALSMCCRVRVQSLLNLGFGSHVTQQLAWCILCMDATPNLCTARYLYWRIRVFACACACLEQTNDWRGAAKAGELLYRLQCYVDGYQLRRLASVAVPMFSRLWGVRRVGVLSPVPVRMNYFDC